MYKDEACQFLPCGLERFGVKAYTSPIAAVGEGIPHDERTISLAVIKYSFVYN
jgi:hypothetical protein